MERLNVSGVTLEGYAQGGWRTSIHVPEVGAVFDAGTVLPRTADHYFVTHGHPDHSGALPSIVARRSILDIAAPLCIYLPERTAQHMQQVLRSMGELFGGRRSLNTRIVPMRVGERAHIGKGLAVCALRTYHGVPSVGYAVEKTTNKLKADFQGLPGPEIAKLRKEGIAVTEERKSTMLVVPGDTKIDFLLREEAARKAKVLLHEVTIWDEGDATVQGCRRYGHTHVQEMVDHCEKFEGEALVLVHRSMKYSRAFIEASLKRRFPSAMLPKIHLFDGGDRGRPEIH